MPGLHLILSDNSDIIEKGKKSLDKILFLENYTKEILLETQSLLIARTNYPDYHVESFQVKNFIVFLEGKIFCDNIEDEISLLVSNIDDKIWLKYWLSNTDGMFNIVIFDQDREEIYFISDALTHLPVYIFDDNDSIILSRDQFFINSIFDQKPDKLGLAQTLFFYYTLGERTLFENIKRNQPGVILKFDLESKITEKIKIFDFDCTPTNENFDSSIQSLKNTFISSCKNRLETYKDKKIVFSQSGGLDSVAVSIGLKDLTENIYSRTFLIKGDQEIKKDVGAAKKSASRYGFQWKKFELLPPNDNIIDLFIKSTYGLNSVELVNILPFFYKIREEFQKNFVVFTGDTGNAIRDFSPDRKIKSKDDVIKVLFSSDRAFKKLHVFPLEIALKLTNVSEKEFQSEIFKLIDNYPEKNIYNKYIHFMLHGYVINWHFQGMNRNLVYNWNSYPLESTIFFFKGIKIAQKKKKRYYTYRKFIQTLEPEKNHYVSNFGGDIEDFRIKRDISKKEMKYFLKMKIKHIIAIFPPKVQVFLKKKIVPEKKEPKFDINSLKPLITKKMEDFLNFDAIKKELLTKRQISALKTILLLMNQTKIKDII